MKLSKMLLSVAVLALAVFAQTNLNFKGYGDTATITGAKGTALFVSKWFPMTNAENKLLCFLFDDTVNAGRVHDTCVAEIGYELGSPLVNIAGNLDTISTNKIVLDTCNSRTAAAKQFNPLLGLTTSQWGQDANGDPVRAHGAIDTTIGTTSSGMFMPFAPFWAPFCRFYLQGLSGNQPTTYIKGKFVLIQRAFSKVGN